jgi:hypothetical protein
VPQFITGVALVGQRGLELEIVKLAGRRVHAREYVLPGGLDREDGVLRCACHERGRSPEPGHGDNRGGNTDP